VQIANANVFGLTTELKLKGTQYNNALVIFFVPYILFEIPSNLLLKKLKPHVWRKRFPLASSDDPLLTICPSIALHVWLRPCDTLPRTCSRLLRSPSYPLFPGRFRIWNVSWLVGNQFSSDRAPADIPRSVSTLLAAGTQELKLRSASRSSSALPLSQALLEVSWRPPSASWTEDLTTGVGGGSSSLYGPS